MFTDNAIALFDIFGWHLISIMGVALLILDRKSTRLNSSHQIIPYAVFCLKKKTRLIVILLAKLLHKRPLKSSNHYPTQDTEINAINYHMRHYY